MDRWKFTVRWHTQGTGDSTYLASVPAKSRDTALMELGAMLFSQHPSAIVDSIHSQIGE